MRSAWRSLLAARSLSRIEPRGLQVRSLQSQSHRFRLFSSKPAAVAPAAGGSDPTLVASIFSKPIESNSPELHSLSLDRDTVHSVLQTLESQPSIANRFFNWVSEKDGKLLRSKSYNVMLGIMGKKGYTEEFWGLVDSMREKGFGITKDAFLKVSQGFSEEENMEKDLNKIKEIYFLNSPQNLVPRVCPGVCKILREEEFSDDIQMKLDELKITLSSELVLAVLDKMSSFPRKALVFFRWVDEDADYEVDGRVYNAMVTVLGREDCIEEFRDILRRMRSAGYGVERETYVKVMDRFYKRRMASASVDLYEFAMAGKEKPPRRDFFLLLKKVVVCKELDLDLVSRVVRVFIKGGNFIKGSSFETVLKSLKSVGRLAESVKVLKAMEEGGFVAYSDVHVQVVVGLCNAKRMDEALEYVTDLEKSGHNPDLKIWTSLAQKFALSGELDRAVSCFREMVERKGGENVGCTFELLVASLCQKNRLEDAVKMLKEMVSKKDLQPWHTTYKFLIAKLVGQANLKEASGLLGLMKSHGFPPFIDPFIGHISKSGTAEDAMGFLKAMTTKDFPSTTVFLRVFETLLKAGRHEVAYDILSLSPGCVRNHADVLDLFYSMKPNEAAIAVAA